MLGERYRQVVNNKGKIKGALAVSAAVLIAVFGGRDSTGYDVWQYPNVPAGGVLEPRKSGNFEELVVVQATPVPVVEPEKAVEPEVVPVAEPTPVFGGVIVSGPSQAIVVPSPPQQFERQPVESFIWDERDLPQSISIDRINYATGIQIAKFKQVAAGWTVDVPDSGIATPESSWRNHMYILGHTASFGTIANLDVGDAIVVQTQAGQAFTFRVREFRLVGAYSSAGAISHEQNLKLTLQTSAKSAGWVLDQNLVLSKVGANRPADLSGQLVLYVIGEPVSVSGAVAIPAKIQSPESPKDVLEIVPFSWQKHEVLFGSQAGFEKARNGQSLTVWVDPTISNLNVAEIIGPWNKLAGWNLFVSGSGSGADIVFTPSDSTLVVPNPDYWGPFSSCTINTNPADRSLLMNAKHNLGHCLGLVDFLPPNWNTAGYINPQRCDNPAKSYFGVMGYCTSGDDQYWFRAHDRKLLGLAGYLR